MIEVFKTNVKTKAQANRITKLLKVNLGYEKVNFDLEDCDKILRIDNPEVLCKSVSILLKEEGYICELLK